MPHVKEMLGFIEDGQYKIVFRWLNKRQWAEINYDKKLISINIYLLITQYFVHEFLHHKYPDSKFPGLSKKQIETEIERRTDNAVMKMRVSEIKELAKIILATSSWKIV